ncbi:unnamed protein product, partial [Tetraodon nigroviridis]
WDLVCDNYWMVPVEEVCFILGILTGCLSLGYAADRLGRSKTLLTSLTLTVVSGVLVCVSPYPTIFIIMRFFLAAASSGVYLTLYIIREYPHPPPPPPALLQWVTAAVALAGLELCEPSLRLLAAVLAGQMTLAGELLLLAVVLGCKTWRCLLGAGAAPLTLFLSYGIPGVFPESPRWLLLSERSADASSFSVRRNSSRDARDDERFTGEPAGPRLESPPASEPRLGFWGGFWWRNHRFVLVSVHLLQSWRRSRPPPPSPTCPSTSSSTARTSGRTCACWASPRESSRGVLSFRTSFFLLPDGCFSAQVHLPRHHSLLQLLPRRRQRHAPQPLLDVPVFCVRGGRSLAVALGNGGQVRPPWHPAPLHDGDGPGLSDPAGPHEVESTAFRCVCGGGEVITTSSGNLSLFPSDLNELAITIFSVVGLFASQAAASLSILFTAEIMPTIIRGSGVGVVVALGCLGRLSSPIMDLKNHYGYFLHHVVYSCLALLAVLSILLLPESKRKPLPQSLADGEQYRRPPLSRRRRRDNVPLLATPNP